MLRADENVAETKCGGKPKEQEKQIIFLGKTTNEIKPNRAKNHLQQKSN
jgi:hypothetical protein